MTVVGLVAEGEDPWVLPPAREAEEPWITGGVRELYLLLAAGAAAGERAELRGPVVRAELDRICAGAGVTVELPAAGRMPADDDVVLVLAGHPDPRFFARRMLAPARSAIVVLAATHRDPIDAEPAEVDRPEHLAAMADLGFAIWTNDPRVVTDAASVGVRAADVHRIAAAGSARAEADLAWAPFVERVRTALAALPDDPGRAARGEIGRLLADERLGLLGLVNEARAQAEATEGRTAR